MTNKVETVETFPGGLGSLSGLQVVFHHRVGRHGYSVFTVVKGLKGNPMTKGTMVQVTDSLALRAGFTTQKGK